MLIVNCLSLLVCISFVGIMFPYGFPLFILTLLATLGLFIVQKKRLVIPYSLWPLLLLQMFFFLAIQASEQIFGNFIKEFINIINMDIFLILLFSEITSQEKMKKFTKNIETIMFFTSIIVALLGIYKFILLLQGQTLSWVSDDTSLYPWGTSLVTDYNSFALGLSIGLLFTFRKLSENRSLVIHIILVLASILLIATIITSGSRRGLLAIPIILAAYTYIWTFRTKTNLSIRLKKILVTVLLFMGIGTAIINTQSINMEINTNHIDTLINRIETLKDGNQLSSSRSIRWDMACTLLNEETSLKNILLGNGFNYLKTFNIYLSETEGEDYPHNIILSALLYSGIIGTIALILFLGNSTWMMFQVRHAYFEWGLFFLLMLLTLFTSANTIFSSKVVILILSIPTLFYRMSRHDVPRQQSPHSL